jgi:hypothetical protein
MQPMGDNSYSTEIVRDGKTLILLTARLQDKHAINYIEDVVEHAFKKILPYLKEKRQVVYIRDVPDFCIDGEVPRVACETATEAVIALPSWSMAPRNLELFDMSVHQAMIMLARVQNIGHSQTFGDEVFNQGIAAHYACLMTGYKPPYEGMMVSKRLLRGALRRWEMRRFYSNWLAGGTYSKWRGHIVGCALAMAIVPRRYDGSFDMDLAVKAPGRMLADQLWGMCHRGSRGIYAFHGYGRRSILTNLFELI